MDSMSFSRQLSFLAIVGLMVLFASEGFHFSTEDQVLTVSMSPWAVLSWVLFLVSIVAALAEAPKSSETNAPWWRGALAVLVDVPLVICFLAIPFCLFVLVVENGGIPSDWLVQRKSGTPMDTLYTVVSLPVFAAIWPGIGFCLHAKITTPGASIANVTIKSKNDLPTWRLAFFGPFAYYGVLVPFFKSFAPGIEVDTRIRAT